MISNFRWMVLPVGSKHYFFSRFLVAALPPPLNFPPNLLSAPPHTAVQDLLVFSPLTHGDPCCSVQAGKITEEEVHLSCQFLGTKLFANGKSTNLSVRFDLPNEFFPFKVDEPQAPVPRACKRSQAKPPTQVGINGDPHHGKVASAGKSSVE